MNDCLLLVEGAWPKDVTNSEWLAMRVARLTNAFSKKLENHAAMVALYFMYYNFGRVHQTIRVTPAMETGIADHVWSIEEIVDLLQ